MIYIVTNRPVLSLLIAFCCDLAGREEYPLLLDSSVIICSGIRLRFGKILLNCWHLSPVFILAFDLEYKVTVYQAHYKSTSSTGITIRSVLLHLQFAMLL